MKGTLKFIFIILIFEISANIFIYSQNLLNKIKELTSSKELAYAEWSVCAKYAENSETIIAFNSNKSLAPASGLKVFTTSTAFDLLGPDFIYKTKLYYSGKIKSGVLKGNLIIKGSGDPTLGSPTMTGAIRLDSLMERWMKILKKMGIENIQGRIVADVSFFNDIPVPGMWYWIDLGNYYAAGTSALSVHDNYYRIYFQPSDTIGNIAKFLRTEPKLFNIKFINNIKTAPKGTGDNGYIYRAPNQKTAILRGTIPQEGKDFSIKGSLPDPPLFLANYLNNYLTNRGILIKHSPIVLTKPTNLLNAVIIDSVESPPLKMIINRILNKSDNFYTEQLLKTFAKIKSGKATRKAGIELIKNYLATNNIDTTGLKLYDGCGLSRSNTITTNMMVDLLVKNMGKPWFKYFFNSLPVVKSNFKKGNSGKFGAGTILQNNARIKNGYISGVRSHSGYLINKAGRTICFSVITNNFNCKVKKIDRVHQKILILLAKTGILSKNNN